MKIIDTQTHWYSRTLLEAYVSSSTYPPCERDGDAYRLELIPGTWMPVPAHFMELDLQFEQFEAAGVDAVVSSSASFGDVDRLPIEVAKELAQALNEERAAAERSHSGFFGLATIPWQDAEAAIEVLGDAVNRLGLRGALLHSNIAGGPVDADYLRPVYRKAAELGTPIFLHPGQTVLEDRVRDYGLEILLAYMVDTSIAALRLIFSGILDEAPELTIVHPHAGAILPYLGGRIDESYAKPFAVGEHLPQLPSAYLAERFYTDTVCQSAETLAFAKRFYGLDRLLFASDYPYFQPGEMAEFTRSHLSEGDQVRVFERNVVELLGIQL